MKGSMKTRDTELLIIPFNSCGCQIFHIQCFLALLELISLLPAKATNTSYSVGQFGLYYFRMLFPVNYKLIYKFILLLIHSTNIVCGGTG